MEIDEAEAEIKKQEMLSFYQNVIQDFFKELSIFDSDKECLLYARLSLEDGMELQKIIRQMKAEYEAKSKN